MLYQFRMHVEEARWPLELPGQPGEPMWPKSALVVQIACLLTSNFKFCNAMSFFSFFSLLPLTVHRSKYKKE